MAGPADSCVTSCGGCENGRTLERATLMTAERGSPRPAINGLLGGIAAPATRTRLSPSPSLIEWRWCHCSIPCDDSSVLHELLDAEPHVRWCETTAGGDPACYSIWPPKGYGQRI